MSSPDNPCEIEFRNVSKRFGPIRALEDVSLVGRRGSVHAVTGENGAGKSTLIKILAGVFAPDAGEILRDGQPIRFQGPKDARAKGVATVFQELTLLPNLTVAENLFLGREPRRAGFIDRPEMRRRAREILARVGVDLDVNDMCGDLTISEQHLIEIAKGAAAPSRIIIYDEPSAALDAPGVEKLVRLIEEQKASGKLVFYISHRLDEIFRFCDVTTVLKDGQHVATRPTRELTRESLVSLMVGRELGQLYPKRAARAAGAPAISVADLAVDATAARVSFTVKRGEILGLAGLEGQGQREIVRGLVGLVPRAGGTVRKHDAAGETAIGEAIVATVRAGVGFVPEDRKSEGLYLPLSIEQNIGLGMLRRASMAARAKIDRPRVKALMQEMNVRARDEKQSVGSLSGGNQQKVMIGRWLAAEVDVLIVEEPTRGVDVGAKAEIYRLLREFADGGGAVVITSSELTEHLGLCDRILVVRDRAIVAELDGATATEEIVMRHALMSAAGQGAPT
jgi:ribose transport system ATP-binding protein